ncbi:MAG TPA: hypothetical protein VGQ57_20080, partial [Polyangiaceae bacterium]|nr:hypothetical protein [Polyangiaceae bacterium]
RIEPGVGTALIRVDGGSAKARSLGLLGLGVGIPTSIVGMAIFSYGKFADVQGARVGGGIVLGAGALVLVSALPALLIGATKVRDGRGSTIARALRTGTLSF